MKFTVILFAAMLVSSCVWQDTTRPSILVIAVEGLSSDLVSCDRNDTDVSSGFKIICEEGVRFTHAFTPSTMSQASLASVLTAKYPGEHGVRDNGSAFLSESNVTVAEVAVEKGYRTSLFSGGPPLWRKSGLDQGFELFEDNLIINLRQIFRPVGEVVRMFNTWLRQEAGSGAFFSVLFLADLQFPRWPTVNEVGLERELGPRGQFEELDESLYGLFQNLKASGRWSNLNVILFGLNGRTSDLRREISSVDLHSGNTQVALFIKPARTDRHQATAWTVDTNVGLVDVGATLFDLFGRQDGIHGGSGESAPISLKSVFDKAQVEWEKERVIFSESGWPQWRGVSAVRVAARQGHMLYIHDTEPLIYNTLIDRLEQQPISARDLVVRGWSQEMQRVFAAANVQAWISLQPSLFEKLRWAEQVDRWERVSEHMKMRLRQLLTTRSWDRQVAGWAAAVFVADRDWAGLQRLGQEFSEATWESVGQIVSGETRAQHEQFGGDVCFRHLFEKNALSPSETTCDDDEFLALVKWIRASGDDKPYAEERFLRVFAERELDELIALHNLQNSLKWDTSLDLPSGPRRTRLALALPEYKSYERIVARRLGKL